MKMKYILLILFIILIIGVIIFICCFKTKKIEIGEFKYFEFGYSTGYAMYSSVNYRVECEDKCIAKIKPDGLSDDDKIEVELTDEEVSKLINILNEYDVSKWNGFNKSDKNVMDGNSFHMYMKMKNDDYISASGYMKWPKNYGNVCGELDSFFDKYIPKNNRDDS